MEHNFPSLISFIWYDANTSLKPDDVSEDYEVPIYLMAYQLFIGYLSLK